MQTQINTPQVFSAAKELGYKLFYPGLAHSAHAGLEPDDRLILIEATLLQQWLRNEKAIDVWFTPMAHGKYKYTMKGRKYPIWTESGAWYTTPQDALLTAIQEALIVAAKQ